MRKLYLGLLVMLAAVSSSSCVSVPGGGFTSYTGYCLVKLCLKHSDSDTTPNLQKMSCDKANAEKYRDSNTGSNQYRIFKETGDGTFVHSGGMGSCELTEQDKNDSWSLQ